MRTIKAEQQQFAPTRGANAPYLLANVVRSTPRRREEEHVGAQVGQQRVRVAEHELDAPLDAVDGRVVPRELQLRRVHVDREHAAARARELNRVAAGAGARLEHHVTPVAGTGNN